MSDETSAVRELIVENTREGLAAARARGRVGGRPSVVNEDLLRAARDLLPDPDHSIESIARLLGVSRATLYDHIPDLQQLRATAHERARTNRPGEGMSWLAYIDESIRIRDGVYVMAACALEDGNAAKARDVMRELEARPGHRLHWHDRKPAGRLAAVQAVGEAGIVGNAGLEGGRVLGPAVNLTGTVGTPKIEYKREGAVGSRSFSTPPTCSKLRPCTPSTSAGLPTDEVGRANKPRPAVPSASSGP